MCHGAHPWFHSEKAKRERAGKNAFFALGASPKFHHLGPVAILAQDLSNTVAIFGFRPRARQVLSQNGHGAKKGSQKAKKATQTDRIDNLEKGQNVKIMPKSQKQKWKRSPGAKMAFGLCKKSKNMDFAKKKTTPKRLFVSRFFAAVSETTALDKNWKVAKNCRS